MTDNLSELQGATTREILAKHLQTLHESRRAFIQSEADERIRRALQHKIRAAIQVFNTNDRVFYKRERQNKRLGAVQVIFQDGQVLFVRHGGILVRVSSNKLIHVDEQFNNNTDKDQNYCNENIFTETCVNEPKTQPEPTIQVKR